MISAAHMLPKRKFRKNVKIWVSWCIFLTDFVLKLFFKGSFKEIYVQNKMIYVDGLSGHFPYE